MTTNPQIAFSHDWLVTYGGGEQILRVLMDHWEDAPVFTLVHDPEGPCGAFTRGRKVETSFIQKLPRARSNHRFYLPFMPLAVEQFDLRAYDLLISISHAAAHGIIPQPDQLHINYICIPMRYAWHLYHQYLQESGLTSGIRAWSAKAVLHYLRIWDKTASERVDNFVAISDWVARNVWRAYRRRADIIYPPVDIKAFPLRANKEDYYLTVSRLVPYKRLDIIVEAFGQMPTKKLFVIGDGPEREKLQAKASKNIEFLGYQPFNTLKEYMQGARAFIYAALEDFGIVPVEAQACGTPVIAYGKGGLLETVIEGTTGLFFKEQSSVALVQAIDTFERGDFRFDPYEIRRCAERFSKERFDGEFMHYVDLKWEEFSGR